MKIKNLGNALLAIVFTFCVTSSVFAQESNTLRIGTGNVSGTIEISANTVIGTPFTLNAATGDGTSNPNDYCDPVAEFCEEGRYCDEYGCFDEAPTCDGVYCYYCEDVETETGCFQVTINEGGGSEGNPNEYCDEAAEFCEEGRYCDEYGCFDEAPYCDETGCYYCEMQEEGEVCFQTGGSEEILDEGEGSGECDAGNICSPSWEGQESYYESFWFSSNVHSWVNNDIPINLAPSSLGSCTVSESVEQPESGNVYMLIANTDVNDPCTHSVFIDERMPLLRGNDYFVFDFYLDMSIGPDAQAKSKFQFDNIFDMELNNQQSLVTAYGITRAVPLVNGRYAVQVIYDNGAVSVTLNNQSVISGFASGNYDGHFFEGMLFTARDGSFKISDLTLDIRSTY